MRREGSVGRGRDHCVLTDPGGRAERDTDESYLDVHLANVHSIRTMCISSGRKES